MPATLLPPSSDDEKDEDDALTGAYDYLLQLPLIRVPHHRGDGAWGARAGPCAVAAHRAPRHGRLGCGGHQRRGPSGGSAYGTFGEADKPAARTP